MMAKLYYLVGGGTAGHVNPALAIAEALKQRDPDCHIIFFVTETGVEKEMVEKAGYETSLIKAARLPRKPLELFSFATTSLAGYHMALKQLKKQKPDAIIATGGFVSGPVLLAARMLKVPYVLHEQNAFPGKSNRFFANHAAAICASFEDSIGRFKSKQPVIYTGNPIRQVFFEKTAERARLELGLASQKFLVLIMGGSLGAGPLNDAVCEAFEKGLWAKLKDRYPELTLAISTGPKKYGDMAKKLSAFDLTDVRLEAYLDSSLWLPAADFYIARAGASSCFEMAATGTPSLFLPFPQAADNHQYYNAAAFVKNRAAILIEDKDFNGQIMLDHISYLIEHRSQLYHMRQRSRDHARPDAAAKVVDVLEQYAIR